MVLEWGLDLTERDSIARQYILGNPVLKINVQSDVLSRFYTES
jgi:hypothetical protein